jgi:hypothetical protein
MMLTEEEINNTRAALNELRVEHRDLNLIVEHLAATPLPEQDQLLIHRLKKRKLLLKDKIYQLERMLVPDVPA